MKCERCGKIFIGSGAASGIVICPVCMHVFAFCKKYRWKKLIAAAGFILTVLGQAIGACLMAGAVLFLAILTIGIVGSSFKRSETTGWLAVMAFAVIIGMSVIAWRVDKVLKLFRQK